MPTCKFLEIKINCLILQNSASYGIMTLNQLGDLTEEELAMALVIVNEIAPPVLPKGPFEPKHLLWFRHDQLIKKFIDIFPRLKPEGHDIYKSMMLKLGVCIQINPQPTPNENNTETSASAAPTTPTDPIPEVTGSAGCPPYPSVPPDVTNVTGSDAAGQPT